MQSRLEGESRCSDYVTIKWFHAVELSINDRPHRAERLPRALTGYAKPFWAISRVWLSKVSLIRMSYSLVKPGIYSSVVKIGKSIFFSRNHNRFSIIGV